MTSKDKLQGDAQRLRKQAEKIVADKAALSAITTESLSPDLMRRTLHELQVHQAELEMQNEELRRAQLELDAARERYFDLYDMAPVGYCMVSENGLILEGNLTIATLLGVNRGALAGKLLSHFILKDDQDIFYLHRKQLFAEGKPQSCELRMMKTDGTTFWAHLEATAEQKQGGAPVLRVVLSDITEHIKAVEANIFAAEEWRTTFDSIADMIAIIDVNHRIMRANKAFAKTLHTTPAEVIGKYCYDVMHDMLEPHEICPFRHTIEIGATHSCEMFEKKLGIALECSTSPVLDSDNRLVAAVHLFRDITERKTAEDKLAQSYALLSNLARLVPGVIYQYRLFPDGHSAFPYSSPGMNDIYECTPEEVREDATPVFGRLHPDDYDRVSNAIQESARTLEEFYCEFRVILPRQGLRWRWSQAHPERTGDGGTIWHGIISDVTEHKQVENNLAKSEAIYHDTFDNAPIGIFRSTAEGKFIMVNNKLAQMLGFETPEEMISLVNQTNIAQTLDIDPQRRARLIEEVKVTSGWTTYDNEYKRKDGSILIGRLTTRVIRKPDGAIDCIEGMIEDITKRKRAEEALQSSEAQHRTILHTALDGFWMVDRQGSLLEVNDAYCRMSGYTREELLSMRIPDLEADETVGGTAAHIQKIMEQGFDRFESQHRRKDGSIFTLLISVQFRPTDGGRLVAFLQDITERKKTEKENTNLREKAEISSRLAAVGEMAAGIAHEINNPLTGVIGFSELLLEANVPPDIKEQLKIIAEGSHRVKDIVRRMLTFARQNKPVKTSTNIHELVDNTLEIRSYVLKTANIEVIRRYDPSLPWVTVDPGQMQQVFINLIVNAEFAMKKAHGKGTLVIATEKKDGHISISFKDDGMGMSQETKAKIFNPFFTTKEVNEGTGLGLSLSHSIILEHNGTIEVESEVGQGATFIITLPVTLVNEAKSPESRVGINPSLEHFRSARILVVDDEEGIRYLVSAILTLSGHTVDTTGDAAEALKSMESKRYDVVVMDIRMPGMNGMDFYARITEKLPEMAGKVIFITGDTSDESVRIFLEQKNLSCISKPFDKGDLIQKVNGLL